MSLSRLSSDLFTKNLHYAANYWMEHEQNFSEMIQKLMDEDTLQQVASSAAALTMTFNHKIEWIPADYNMEVVHLAYANFMEETKKDKRFLCGLASAYFNTFVQLIDFFDPGVTALPRNRMDPKNSPELVNLKNVFKNTAFDNAQLHPYTLKLLGQGYNVELCFQHFYPQLMLFLLRFLDIYDQSMQGLTVQEYMQKDFNLRPQKKTDEREKLMKNMGQEILKSFGTPEFWTSRYSKVTPQTPTYDWYITWPELKSNLLPHIPFFKQANIPKDLTVLHVGCGNSSISEDLYDSGLRNIIGIDFCQSVIQLMQDRRDKSKRTSLVYQVMDARGLRFSDKLFDLVIDKGCVDSMVCTPSGLNESRQYVNTYFREIARVLKPGGYYVLVSCGIDDTSNLLHFKDLGWETIFSGKIKPKEGLEMEVSLTIVKSK